MGWIINNIKNRAEGIFYSNRALELLFIPIHLLLIKPMVRKAFVERLNMPPDTKIEELIPMMDIGYHTTTACDGCRICAKVCPVGNIKMEDQKPVWLHHCENCLACYNWCPNQAIQGGIASVDYYYRHPEIMLSEIIKQGTNDK